MVEITIQENLSDDWQFSNIDILKVYKKVSKL